MYVIYYIYTCMYYIITVLHYYLFTIYFYFYCIVCFIIHYTRKLHVNMSKLQRKTLYFITIFYCILYIVNIIQILLYFFTLYYILIPIPELLVPWVAPAPPLLTGEGNGPHKKLTDEGKQTAKKYWGYS